MTQFIDTLVGLFQSSGFAQFGQPGGWLYAVMICVGCFLLYLAIVKEFEPLILLPMAFGMILANLPGSGIIHMQYFVGDGLEHPIPGNALWRVRRVLVSDIVAYCRVILMLYFLDYFVYRYVFPG